MSRNVSGQAYALTVLTPIEHGREQALTAYLDALGDGDASPLARVPGTHLARWVVIGQVKRQEGQRRPDALKAPRLLFTSNFDGSLNPYLEALRTGLAGDADAIWGNCTGYPATRTPPASPSGSATTRSRRRCSSAPMASRRSPMCTPPSPRARA